MPLSRWPHHQQCFSLGCFIIQQLDKCIWCPIYNHITPKTSLSNHLQSLDWLTTAAQAWCLIWWLYGLRVEWYSSWYQMDFLRPISINNINSDYFSVPYMSMFQSLFYQSKCFSFISSWNWRLYGSLPWRQHPYLMWAASTLLWLHHQGETGKQPENFWCGNRPFKTYFYFALLKYTRWFPNWNTETFN